MFTPVCRKNRPFFTCLFNASQNIQYYITNLKFINPLQDSQNMQLHAEVLLPHIVTVRTYEQLKTRCSVNHGQQKNRPAAKPRHLPAAFGLIARIVRVSVMHRRVIIRKRVSVPGSSDLQQTAGSPALCITYIPCYSIYK